MNGAAARLAGVTQRSARGYAWLAFSLTVLPLVPLPSLALDAHAGLLGEGLAGVPEALQALVSATPAFATIPFVVGGAMGTFFHLVLTAPERFEALESGSEPPLGVCSMAASSLLVGAMFASTGLALATALLGVA